MFEVLDANHRAPPRPSLDRSHPRAEWCDEVYAELIDGQFDWQTRRHGHSLLHLLALSEQYATRQFRIANTIGLDIYFSSFWRV